jgi:ribose/xylose/arabinose/galactoside ABC-type transport system permease subunit
MTPGRIWHWVMEQRIFMLLFVLIGGLSLFNDGFLAGRNLQNLAIAVSIEGVMVVGMTIVMIGRGFDLSIGSVMALAGVLVMDMQTLGIPMAVAIALSAAALAGLSNGLLIARAGVNPFIATLGTMIVVRGIVMTYTDAQPMVGADLTLMWLGRGKVLGVPIPAVIFALALVLGHLFLAHIRLGRDVYALGGNEDAARASGIRTDRVKLLTYTLCGLSAGIAGVVLAARLNTGSPIIGETTALNVITAVLLGGISLSGGIGSIPAALAGLLCVGVLGNGLNLLDVPAYYQRIAQGLLLISLVAADRVTALRASRLLHARAVGSIDA